MEDSVRFRLAYQLCSMVLSLLADDRGASHLNGQEICPQVCKIRSIQPVQIHGRQLCQLCGCLCYPELM